MKKFLLVFAIAGLALAGCGGSSSDDSGNGGSGGGDDQFSQLLEKQSKANIRVTYRTGDGDEWTVSQDGAGKVAYIRDDTHLIKDGGTVTSCNNIDTEPECTEATGTLAEAALTPFTGLFGLANTYIEAAKQANSFGDTSSETIAGRSAECVTITLENLGGIAGNIAGKIAGDRADDGFKTCADKETGILLLWQPVGVDEAANDSKVEAIEVTEPRDSDFTPPATTATTVPDDTTDDTTDTSAPDDENCTRITLPTGITMPSGITLPCE